MSSFYQSPIAYEIEHLSMVRTMFRYWNEQYHQNKNNTEPFSPDDTMPTNQWYNIRRMERLRWIREAQNMIRVHLVRYPLA